MKRIGVVVAALAVFGIGIAIAAPTYRGELTLRAAPGQTSASSIMLDVQNAAGSTVASCDIEGDLSVRNITASGTFTRANDNFADGLTVNTSKLTVASTGAIALDTNKFTVSAAGAGHFASTLNSAGAFSVATDKFTCSAAGAGHFASTLNSAGAFSVATDKFNVSATGVTAIAGAVTAASTITATGAIAGPATVVSASSGSTNVTAVQSGGYFFNTGTSGTTTFVLPGAAAGLRYCFIEAGNAGGELLINPTAGDVISGKVTVDGAQMVTAAGSGIKNTGGSNTVDDSICLIALDGTTWYMTPISGVWAAQ